MNLQEILSRTEFSKRTPLITECFFLHELYVTPHHRPRHDRRFQVIAHLFTIRKRLFLLCVLVRRFHFRQRFHTNQGAYIDVVLPKVLKSVQGSWLRPGFSDVSSNVPRVDGLNRMKTRYRCYLHVMYVCVF